VELGENVVSVKEEMVRAKQLIQAKKYNEARVILEKIDHPVAKDWLSKLPRPKASGKKVSAKSNKPNPAKASKVKQARSKNPSPAKSSNPKQARPKAKPSGSRPRFLLPMVAIVLLVVIVGVVTVVVLPSLSNNTNNTVAENPTEAVLADTQNTNDDNSEAETDNNNNDESSSENNPPTNTSSDEIVPSGVRFPILDGSDFLYDVELPQGYTCECNIMSNSIYGENPRNSFRISVASRAFDPDYYLDKTLDEMITDSVRDDEILQGQGVVQVNGRDVMIARVADDDGDVEISYNVKDNDGHIIRVIVPNWMDEPQLLHDAALFVAGNVEGESGDAPAELYNLINDSSVRFNEEDHRWYFGDLLDTSRQNSVEVPEGWAIDDATLLRMAIKGGDADTSATAIVSQQQKVFDDDMTFEQWVNERFEASSETLESQEVVTMGERDIVIRIEYDAEADQRTTNYYVKDSDRDFIALITQPSVPIENQATLRDDIIFMASNVESEEISWEDQLRRVGALEG